MPSCGAGIEARPPLNFPIGVRAADRMTTSFTCLARRFGGLRGITLMFAEEVA
jgi:hypothetical protein